VRLLVRQEKEIQPMNSVSTIPETQTAEKEKTMNQGNEETLVNFRSAMELIQLSIDAPDKWKVERQKWREEWLRTGGCQQKHRIQGVNQDDETRT
jgi:hypothetical protein